MGQKPGDGDLRNRLKGTRLNTRLEGARAEGITDRQKAQTKCSNQLFPTMSGPAAATVWVLMNRVGAAYPPQSKQEWAYPER